MSSLKQSSPGVERVRDPFFETRPWTCSSFLPDLGMEKSGSLRMDFCDCLCFTGARRSFGGGRTGRTPDRFQTWDLPPVLQIVGCFETNTTRSTRSEEGWGVEVLRSSFDPRRHRTRAPIQRPLPTAVACSAFSSIKNRPQKQPFWRSWKIYRKLGHEPNNKQVL